RISGADRTLVDFNRAWTPLVEIVTAPDIHSAEHAKRFLQLLRQTVVELGISDAEMEKGSLRFDVNVSVRSEGSDELRTRNVLMNQFAATGIDPASVNAEELAKLIEARDRIPRQAFTEALAASGSEDFSAERFLGDGQITESGDLEPVVDRILAANPGQVES